MTDVRIRIGTAIQIDVYGVDDTQRPDEQLVILKRMEGTLNSMPRQIDEAFGRINAATNNLAEDIRTLLARPDVPADVTAEAERIATQLEGIASAYNPVPVEPGETPGDTEVPAEDEPGEAETPGGDTPTEPGAGDTPSTGRGR